MNRKATSVTQLFPKTTRGDTIYLTAHYEVGKWCQVAGYKWTELVEEIRVISSWQPHIEIEFQDYGEIWITSHIIEIRFENSDYREVRNAREAAKKESKQQ